MATNDDGRYMQFFIKSTFPLTKDRLRTTCMVTDSSPLIKVLVTYGCRLDQIERKPKLFDFFWFQCFRVKFYRGSISFHVV